MRAFLLALVIGVTSLGGLALAPSHADAHEWQSNDDTIAVRWRGWSHYRNFGGSYYYTPYYWGGYSYPSYYSTPSYYYSPGYDYYSPGYNYYYSPGYYNYPTYRYYSRPGFRFYLGL